MQSKFPNQDLVRLVMVDNLNHPLIITDYATCTYCFLAQTNEPQSMHEALSSPKSYSWQQAMDSKYEYLIKNCTWKTCGLTNKSEYC